MNDLGNGPVHAVGAVVHDPAGRLLLVRRGRPPHAGLWSVPGGRVEAGETDAATLVREVAEETGLAVLPGRFLGAVERDAPGGRVFAIRDYLATPAPGVRPGDAVAGDDAAAVTWATAADLDRLALVPGLRDFLAATGALPR